MVRISRGTIAIMLAGLMLVILPGAALAQNGVQTWSEAYPVESYGPNRTVLEKYGDVVVNAQNWDKTNPVEYYGAYQIALDQHNEMQLRAQNWDKTNPVEYYSALPMAMAQYNPAVMGEQGWDSTHTEEYYSVPPSTMDTLVATDSDELSSDTATCDQC